MDGVGDTLWHLYHSFHACNALIPIHTANRITFIQIHCSDVYGLLMTY